MPKYEESNLTAEWMFETWPPGTFGADRQRLSMAWLRLYVVAIHRPLTPIVRWLARRIP